MSSLIRKVTSSILVIALLSASVGIFIDPKPVAAADISNWNPALIISDVVFINKNSMSAGEIQAFLNSKVPVCDTNGSGSYAGTTKAAYGTSRGYPPPYTCLKDFSENGISAAQIIYNKAQEFSINPQVLIVLLQKEQGLVTDDWPWSTQYRSATGYGCPDSTPGVCDSAYYGFTNQVHNAARMFRKIMDNDPNWYTPYQPGSNTILWHPNSGCGTSELNLLNRATAALYNYTPYRPNQAALNNLYGTGDGCSSYGNRNFWRDFTDWFGSTTTTTPYAWAYEGQWAYSDAGRTQTFTSTPTVAPGGKIYARVKARNMGNQNWDQSFIHLGASRPFDRVSPFADPSWLSNTRPARLVESTVVPGQVGTFDFELLAPNSPGSFNEYYNLLAEGITWMNDLGLYYTINVNTSVSATNSSYTLNSGESINKDGTLMSPDEQSLLTVQRDGNLALYSNFKIAWSTGAVGGNKLVMQTDGNLVLYNSSNQALWASSTNGNAGARLVLQTDGNMVIYSSSNVPLWATYTTHNPDHLAYVNTTLETGRMYPGQSLTTANRQYRLIMQPDGNLVLYSQSGPLWATHTVSNSVAFVAMQSDGNLVLYDKNGGPIWFSGTSGHGSLKLVIQQDGNLVMYNNANQAFWSTGTSGN